LVVDWIAGEYTPCFVASRSRRNAGNPAGHARRL